MDAAPAVDSETPPRDAAPRWAGVAVTAAVVALTALLAAVALTRTRVLTTDSMNYVDVARHVAAGDGIVQSTLGFNQRLDAALPLPSPLTAQPPLYPFAIAAGIVCGIDGTDAALAVAALSVGLALFAAFAATRLSFGAGPAFVALGALAVLEPLLHAGNAALSDAPGVALTLAALAAAGDAQHRERPERAALVAGIVSGLAFAVRYAALPVAAVAGAAVALLPSRGGCFRRGVRFAAGFGVVALPIVLRNAALGAGALGRERLPSEDPFAANAARAWVALTESWLPSAVPPLLQLVVLGAALGAAAVLLARRGTLREALLGGGRWLLPVAGLGALAALLVSRSRVHFDPIDARLTLPVAAALLVWLAALLGGALGITPARGAAFAVAMCAVTGWRLAAELRASPPLRDADPPRVAWVRANTGEHDLVLGEDTVDVPFRIPGRLAASFSRHPYSEHPTAESLLAVVRAYGREGGGGSGRAWLLIGAHELPREEWRRRYGAFVDALVHEPEMPHPAFSRIGVTRDALILGIRP